MAAIDKAIESAIEIRDLRIRQVELMDEMIAALYVKKLWPDAKYPVKSHFIIASRKVTLVMTDAAKGKLEITGKDIPDVLIDRSKQRKDIRKYLKVKR